MDLRQFNAAHEEELTPALLACCDVPAWAATVLAGRPYPDIDALLTAADAAASRLTRAEVDRALEAHPRIGERVQGRSTQSAWSAQEQGAVSRDQTTLAELHRVNEAYEDRFDRVFLICATGLSETEILAAAQQRLTNDDETEAGVVAEELRKIARLRLQKAVDQ